jgi:hypothetical protein
MNAGSRLNSAGVLIYNLGIDCIENATSKNSIVE